MSKTTRSLLSTEPFTLMLTNPYRFTFFSFSKLNQNQRRPTASHLNLLKSVYIHYLLHSIFTLLMASSSSLNLFIFSLISIFFLCKSQISDSVNGVVYSVVKDIPTGQYIAQIHLGEPSSDPIKVVVDLAGSLLWLDCSSGHVSSSRSIVSGSSSGCLKANVGIDRLSSRGRDFNADCELLVRNGVVGVTARGELARDVLSFGSVASSPGTVDLLFACASPWLLRGLATEAQGVLGLGRAQISLPSQLATETNERRRLTVYLSPVNGVVSTSPVEKVFGVGVSRSLVYTPLITGSSGDYVINAKSIRVNGIKLSLDGGPLATELSTVVPYTMLESSIYTAVAESYTKAATKATLVAPVVPFGLCFTSSSWSEVDFPAVELSLQSEMVRWKIQGRNLMVDVGGGVRCLGIVDGGSNQVNPILMGGLQLEGFILDFDMGNSMMGFGQRTRSGSDSLQLQPL